MSFPTLSPSLHRQLDWCSWIGQIAVPVGVGLYALNRRDFEGIQTLAGAIIVNQIFLELMKRLIPTVRPNGRPGSFPSGHTAAVFLGATFLALRYKTGAIPLTLAFLGATLVGMSRLVLRAHWIRDVVGGIFLGTSIAYIFTKQRRDENF
jgi:membrane-associated phospholipid phosphatase